MYNKRPPSDFEAMSPEAFTISVVVGMLTVMLTFGMFILKLIDTLKIEKKK